MSGTAWRWLGPLGAALLLALAVAAPRSAQGAPVTGRPAAAQAAGAWEREGLEGSDVRAVVVDADGGRLVALLARGGTESPLRLRGPRGWAQPEAGSLPNLVLSLGALRDGGVLLGIGRDVSDTPGVFHGSGSPLTYRRLYDGQAIGALTSAPGRGGNDLYAATAPWADRDVRSELLRREAGASAWTMALRGTLVCGPQPPFFRQVEVARGEARVVYALEWCFQSVLRQTQLWRSADRGQSWQAFVPRKAGPYARSLAVDPGDADVLYVAHFEAAGQPEPGVDVSRDGGKNWQVVGGDVDELTDVRTLLTDPRSPGRVLAGTERNGVLLSDDYGRSWQVLAGLEGLRIWALAIDPEAERLYAATADGVWGTELPAP